MKSKRGEEEHGHDNSERWLLTYSDLITLLLALFIIMYSMSAIDQKKYEQLSQAMSEALNNPNAGEGNGPGTGSTDSVEGGGAKEDTTAYSGQAPEPSPLDEIYNQLNKYVQDNKLQNTIDLEHTDTYVRVTVKDVLLFVPDSPTMLEQSKPILAQIEKAINGVYQKIDHVTISGHTADPSNDKYYSSDFAWALSTQRAVTVLEYMVDCGLPQNKLSIEGYSHFAPIADNTSAKGRAQNRRVEIIITKNKGQSNTTSTSGITNSAASTGAGTSSTTSSKSETSSTASESSHGSEAEKGSTSGESGTSHASTSGSAEKTVKTNPYEE